ncbi:DNA-binding MurR/RpiR family transcriptional regulator [Inquilinus ginsengisoli]|uniref:MurR/RpiR family transcriptional regulator n=1 Tax=Inquilinus ginsengisoli TaxID=363840 RepID=UPI003D2519B2
MTDSAPLPIDQRVEAALERLSPAEQRVARFLVAQKETALLSSAAEIAARAGTSDATVVRTARSLGFEGLSQLREALLADLTGTTTPGSRMRRTLDDVGGDAAGALQHVLSIHREATEVLARPEFQQPFAHAVEILAAARRRHVFGIGPSGSLAEYAALQFSRIGLPSEALAATGVGLADRLLRVAEGDALILIAYAPIYREVAVTLDVAERHRVPVLLVSDSLGPFVRDRVAEILPVPRGRADHLSMHAGTMLLIEALVVALAARDRERALAGLETLGALRGEIDKLWLRRGPKRTP